MKHLIACSFTLSIALLTGGCGEKPAPAPAPKAEEPAPPPEPVAVTVTRGTLEFAALVTPEPTDIEVIVLPEMTPELAAQLAEQQDLYVAVKLPEFQPEEADDGTIDDMDLLSERDIKRLQEELDEIKANFPRPMASDFTVGGSLESFTSRESLYNRYAGLNSNMTLENMIDSLNQITEQMRADYTVLQEEESYGETRRGYQARADINWLAAVSEYMEDFERLVRRYDALRRRGVRRLEREMSNEVHPEDAFEDYQQENSVSLQVEVFKTALGNAHVNDDRSFEVTGEGVLVISIPDSKGRPMMLNPDAEKPLVFVHQLETAEVVPGGN